MKEYRKVNFNEAGIVMPLVVAVIAIVIVLGFTVAFVVQSQTTMGQRYSESEEALFIAEAGVNRALFLLNEHSDFYSNPDAYDYNDDDGNILPNGSFELELIPANEDEPFFTIRSTGTREADPDARRTLEVTVRKRDFTNYIYFSDNDGSNIWWLGDEKCFGPLHTNTTLNIKDSPTFYSTVTYGVDLNQGTPYNPVFLHYPGYQPQQVDPLVFPATNQKLEMVTQAHYPEHHYTGRTSILLDGSVYHVRNATDGYVKITKPLPHDGVIYVAGDQGTGYPTPNKFAGNMGNLFISGQASGRVTIAAANNIYITGRDPTEFNYSAADPTPCGGICYTNTSFNVNYTTGDVSRSGNDMLGLVANNFIYILCWGWFDYADAAASSQRIYRPDVSASDHVNLHAAVFALNEGFGFEPYYMDSDGNYINAWNQPIWTSDHTGKGEIKLRGALIQNTRKPVGIMTSPPRGFDKDYVHDPRMRYDTPPHFLEPENAGWEIESWRELPSP